MSSCNKINREYLLHTNNGILFLDLHNVWLFTLENTVMKFLSLLAPVLLQQSNRDFTCAAGTEGRSPLCSHIIFSVLWNACLSPEYSVFSKESVFKMGRDRGCFCDRGNPEKVTAEEISGLWEPVCFAACILQWSSAKNLMILKHLWLHDAYLALLLLKNSKSVTHHYFRKNLWCIKGSLRVTCSYFLTLCHIYWLKMNEAHYFISFYMFEPNIIFPLVIKVFKQLQDLLNISMPMLLSGKQQLRDFCSTGEAQGFLQQ